MCAAYFVKLYCDTRNIPTENIRLSQNNIVDPENRYQQIFKIQVELPADISEKDRLGILRSIDRCTVKKVVQTGPEFVIDDELSLECLRIPHFYRAFYVYKYATGLSAAIALAERVSKGGAAELDAYLNFLRGGCSKDPLDLLRDAGVDMATPQPVAAALTRFSNLVKELDRLLA